VNILSLRGIENVTQAFIDKLQGMSAINGWDPFGIASVISFESGFSTVAKNPKSTATGLIQFTEQTAKGLGTSIPALMSMSAIDQLDYVGKYFQKYLTKIPTRYEDYELVVLGSGKSHLIGASDDAIVYDGRDPDERSAYLGNGAVFDNPNHISMKTAGRNWQPSDGKGYFTVGDVRREVSARTRGKIGKLAVAAGGAELFIWATLGFFAWRRAKAKARGA